MEINPTGLTGDEALEGLLRIRPGQCGERDEALRPPPAAVGRPGVDDQAAAHRAPCRWIAKYEPVAIERADRAFEHDLAKSLFARRQPLAIEDRKACRDARGTEMKVDAGTVTQRAVLASQQPDMRIDTVRWRVQRLVEHPVAALDAVLLDLRADEVERSAYQHAQVAPERSGRGAPARARRCPKAR